MALVLLSLTSPAHLNNRSNPSFGSPAPARGAPLLAGKWNERARAASCQAAVVAVADLEHIYARCVSAAGGEPPKPPSLAQLDEHAKLATGCCQVLPENLAQGSGDVIARIVFVKWPCS
eukprot:1205827-Alexandrium_andersonii.AAC.1